MQISNFKGLKSLTFETLRLFSTDTVMLLEFSDDILMLLEIKNIQNKLETLPSVCDSNLNSSCNIHSTTIYCMPTKGLVLYAKRFRSLNSEFLGYYLQL